MGEMESLFGPDGQEKLSEEELELKPEEKKSFRHAKSYIAGFRSTWHTLGSR